MAFSVGYSLPMAGVLVGLGFGFARLKSAVQRIGPAINKAAGALLIAVGFYLLVTA